MGAGITIEGRCAVIPGDKKLKGAQVISTDLRAGAAMVACRTRSRGRYRDICDIPYRTRIHRLCRKAQRDRR